MRTHLNYEDRVKLMGGRRPLLLVFCKDIKRARWWLNNDIQFRMTADNYVKVRFVAHLEYKRGIHDYDYISIDGENFEEPGDKANCVGQIRG